jgi:BirA family biotin operon repressor/biotin-[acetyl-CoA-carboxylase] ligase
MTRDQAWETMVATGHLGPLAVKYLPVTGSTNDEALSLAREGAPTGIMVVAESQERGRGRLGKEWLSPPAVGLYCSIILRPRLAPDALPRLTLAAGLAVSRAIEKTCCLAVRLKWPNDLWLGERKFGGILAEALFGAGGNLVVLGVGLNVNTDPTAFPAALQGKITSLRHETGHIWARSTLLLAIREEILTVVARLEAEGFSSILAEWRKRDALYGRELSWISQNGSLVLGVALGPDSDGLLRIRDERGRIHEVLSGDLTLLQADRNLEFPDDN